MRRLGLALLLVLPLAASCGSSSDAPDFNAQQIAWQDYEQGLQAAPSLGKPICMVIYAPWCPHCHNYAEVFHDPEIVDLSKRFVMILVNYDERPDLDAQYDLDGDYVPRTIFMSHDAVVDPEIHADRTDHVYAYDEHDPADLARGMKAALDRLQ